MLFRKNQFISFSALSMRCRCRRRVWKATAPSPPCTGADCSLGAGGQNRASQPACHALPPGCPPNTHLNDDVLEAGQLDDGALDVAVHGAAAGTDALQPEEQLAVAGRAAACRAHVCSALPLSRAPHTSRLNLSKRPAERTARPQAAAAAAAAASRARGPWMMPSAVESSISLYCTPVWQNVAATLRTAPRGWGQAAQAHLAAAWQRQGRGSGQHAVCASRHNRRHPRRRPVAPQDGGERISCAEAGRVLHAHHQLQQRLDCSGRMERHKLVSRSGAPAAAALAAPPDIHTHPGRSQTPPGSSSGQTRRP